MSARRGNRTPVTAAHRLVWRIVALAVALWGGQASAVAKDWSRPQSEQSAIRWDAFSGYWRGYFGSEIVFISRGGLVEADIWKGDISLFATRWRPVRRLVPVVYNTPTWEHLVVATDELWCSTFGPSAPKGEVYHWYRELSVWGRGKDEEMSANYAVSFSAPKDIWRADPAAMWGQYRREAATSNFKGEGPWPRLPEDQVPQWFRDLHPRDLIAHPRCRP